MYSNSGEWRSTTSAQLDAPDRKTGWIKRACLKRKVKLKQRSSVLEVFLD